jgi:phosphoribosylformylglycinamidine (FGAM) synthase-like enzyme
VQKLNRDGLLLAYHDRSDGGLFVAACEMAFATRRGVSLDLDGLCYDAGAGDVDGSEKLTNLLAGRDFENIVRALFNEELGALIQIRRADREKSRRSCAPCVCRTTSSAPERVGRNPRYPQRQARAARKRASTCSVPGPRPATRCRPARQPELCATRIRSHPRRYRSWPDAEAHV